MIERAVNMYVVFSEKYALYSTNVFSPGELLSYITPQYMYIVHSRSPTVIYIRTNPATTVEHLEPSVISMARTIPKITRDQPWQAPSLSSARVSLLAVSTRQIVSDCPLTLSRLTVACGAQSDLIYKPDGLCAVWSSACSAEDVRFYGVFRQDTEPLYRFTDGDPQ